MSTIIKNFKDNCGKCGACCTFNGKPCEYLDGEIGIKVSCKATESKQCSLNTEKKPFFYSGRKNIINHFCDNNRYTNSLLPLIQTIQFFKKPNA